ncbi:hypothetical protein, partial [Tsukamurella ocularis]|uniref:hypothetical protein n=1 Tax=Tsukamurella ocularis TaxID=1970234 RepID=UPI0021685D44
PRLACSLRTQQCVDEIVSAKIFWHAWTIRLFWLFVLWLFSFISLRDVFLESLIFVSGFVFCSGFPDYAETLCF